MIEEMVDRQRGCGATTRNVMHGLVVLTLADGPRRHRRFARSRSRSPSDRRLLDNLWEGSIQGTRRRGCSPAPGRTRITTPGRTRTRTHRVPSVPLRRSTPSRPRRCPPEIVELSIPDPDCYTGSRDWRNRSVVGCPITPLPVQVPQPWLDPPMADLTPADRSCPPPVPDHAQPNHGTPPFARAAATPTRSHPDRRCYFKPLSEIPSMSWSSRKGRTGGRIATTAVKGQIVCGHSLPLI